MSDAAEIRTKPPCSREDATAVLKRLREAGHVTYFAGGCVRDLLMGLEAKDWDVATDAPPKRMKQLFPRTQAVGQMFGVTLVRQGKSVVEVATFRKEGRYLDGRRPAEVHFTTAEEDAKRRDFTINGLFLDPLENDRVIDYVGGQEDVKARRLRAIGDARRRFGEDHLRLLRGVRFAARFSLEIEKETAAAMAADAPLLKQISPERIADELRLMLTAPTRGEAWGLLWRFGLADVIYRFLPGAAAKEFSPERSIFLATAEGEAIPFGLALAAGALCRQWQAMAEGADVRTALARPAARQIVRAMRQGLRISNEESKEMRGILEGMEVLLRDERPGVAGMKRFLAGTAARQSRRLLDALERVGLCGERIEWMKRELGEMEKGDVAPAPLITGDDLVEAGLAPGPKYKKILEAVYDAQLEERVRDREAAMKMAMEMGA